jgi:hypothetical protein
MIEHLLRLFDHMEWADRRILASLGQSPAPPPKALTLLAHLAGAVGSGSAASAERTAPGSPCGLPN